MAAITSGAFWRHRTCRWTRAAWWFSLAQVALIAAGTAVLLKPDLVDWLGRQLAGL